MNPLRKMMIDALMVGADEADRATLETWVVPDWLLPPGDGWKMLEDDEFDGVTWSDGVPEELGKDGRAWLIRDDVLWVYGVADGLRCLMAVYWRFVRA